MTWRARAGSAHPANRGRGRAAEAGFGGRATAEHLLAQQKRGWTVIAPADSMGSPRGTHRRCGSPSTAWQRRRRRVEAERVVQSSPALLHAQAWSERTRRIERLERRPRQIRGSSSSSMSCSCKRCHLRWTGATRAQPRRNRAVVAGNAARVPTAKPSGAGRCRRGGGAAPSPPGSRSACRSSRRAGGGVPVGAPGGPSGGFMPLWHTPPSQNPP